MLVLLNSTLVTTVREDVSRNAETDRIGETDKTDKKDKKNKNYKNRAKNKNLRLNLVKISYI